MRACSLVLCLVGLTGAAELRGSFGFEQKQRSTSGIAALYSRVNDIQEKMTAVKMLKAKMEKQQRERIEAKLKAEGIALSMAEGQKKLIALAKSLGSGNTERLQDNAQAMEEQIKVLEAWADKEKDFTEYEAARKAADAKAAADAQAEKTRVYMEKKKEEFAKRRVEVEQMKLENGISESEVAALRRRNTLIEQQKEAEEAAVEAKRKTAQEARANAEQEKKIQAAEMEEAIASGQVKRGEDPRDPEFGDEQPEDWQVQMMKHAQSNVKASALLAKAARPPVPTPLEEVMSGAKNQLKLALCGGDAGQRKAKQYAFFGAKSWCNW